MPVVVIPLLSTLITAGLFITVLGRPIKALSDALTSWPEQHERRERHRCSASSSAR